MLGMCNQHFCEYKPMKCNVNNQTTFNKNKKIVYINSDMFEAQNRIFVSATARLLH